MSNKLFVLLSFLCFSKQVQSQVWKEHVKLASSYYQQDEADSSIRYFQLAKSNFGADSLSSLDYAAICDSLGDVYTTIRYNSRAIPHYLTSYRIVERILGKQSKSYSEISTRLGEAYLGLRLSEEARPYLFEAKRVIEELQGKKNLDYANCCSNIGILYLDLFQYPLAVEYFRESLDIAEEVLGESHPDTDNFRNNLAYVYNVMGKLDEAERYYVKNMEIVGRNDIALDNLGTLYFEQSRYEEAESLMLEAKQVREKYKGKSHPDYARSCQNLAVLYDEINQSEKAEKYYKESLNVLAKSLGVNHEEYLFTAMNIAGFYLEAERYAESEKYFLETLNKVLKRKKGKESDLYMNCAIGLGNHYKARKNYPKAVYYLSEAKEICSRLYGKESIHYADILRNEGGLCLETGQLRRADSLLQTGKSLIAAIVGKESWKYSECAFLLGKLNWQTGDADKASEYFNEAFALNFQRIKKVFDFTSEREKKQFIKRLSTDLAVYHSFYYQTAKGGDVPFNISMLSRNLVLNASRDIRKRIYQYADSSEQANWDVFTDVKKQLAFWYAQPVSERPDYVASLETTADSLEKGFAKFSSRFDYEKDFHITWKNLQEKLEPTEAIVEFAEFPYYNGKDWTDSTLYIAYLLRKDKDKPETIFLTEKKTLDNLLKVTPLLALDRLYGRSEKTLSPTLYDLIWKPLEPALENINTIYFSPAGKLHKVSFAALTDMDGEMLNERYRMVRLFSPALATERETGSFTIDTTLSINIYGGVQYDADSNALVIAAKKYKGFVASRSVNPGIIRDSRQRFSFLPGTLKEASTISVLARQYRVPSSLFTALEANEESIKYLTESRSPFILHIATHGYFFPDPGKSLRSNVKQQNAFQYSEDPLIRSGLLLSGANQTWNGKPLRGVEDGILTAYEVSNMYLLNTKLAVLSACETGLGDIHGSEGVYGLQRAFKMAGVENLVMSLWKVPDAETAEFMQEFYKNIFTKQKISDAFYNAQTLMRNKYRKEPYKWAAWVLIR